MSVTHEPTRLRLQRRRRPSWRRWLDRPLRWLRYVVDVEYARRSDAGKKAAETRRARRGVSMAVKASEQQETVWEYCDWTSEPQQTAEHAVDGLGQ